jgi:lipopolysaccharide/colanic/teichoic acid biosynthesis glycosyltransferase
MVQHKQTFMHTRFHSNQVLCSLFDIFLNSTKITCQKVINLNKIVTLSPILLIFCLLLSFKYKSSIAFQKCVVSINSGASKVILLKDLVIDKSVQSIVLIQLRNHDRSRISSPSICFTSEVSRIVLIILLVP